MKVYNAMRSVLGFLVFWEGWKVKKKTNRMYTANKRALSCPQIRFELEVLGFIYWLFISPMLAVRSVMAGHVDGVESNSDLVPVVAALLDILEHPTPSVISDMISGKRGLIPLFDQDNKRMHALN